MTKFPIFKRKRVNPVSGEVVSRKSGLPRLRWILLLLLLVASVAFNIIFYNRLISSRDTLKAVEKQKQAAMVDATEPLTENSESPTGVWYGLCRKNSIKTIEDFKKTVETDPVLTKHFADFDWGNARIGKLDQDIFAHLAYRKNERIWTTRRLIRLPKGDGYLTDGNRWVRTFCCNDYVAGPQGPYDLIDTNLNRLVERADSTSRAVEGMKRDGGNVSIPEPATLFLTGAGLSFFGILRRKWKLKNKP